MFAGNAIPFAVDENCLMSLDDEMIDTLMVRSPGAQWKKKHPVQIPSRRTRGKDLPVKVKRYTDEK